MEIWKIWSRVNLLQAILETSRKGNLPIINMNKNLCFTHFCFATGVYKLNNSLIICDILDPENSLKDQIITLKNRISIKKIIAR